MSEIEPRNSKISPALAAFVSGAASTILTIAATLVSLQTSASKEDLFLILGWTMYAAAAATTLVLAWIAVVTLRASIHELRHLKDLEAHVSNFIRYRRRDDQLRLLSNGDAVMRFEGEVECAANSYAPWLTLPIYTDTAPNASEWKNARVRLVSVDGVNFDPIQTCMRKSRIQTVDTPSLITEELAVRVPIALGPDRRCCTYVVEVDVLAGSFGLLKDDYQFADVAYITDEINVHIVGTGGLQVFCSPDADYRVHASRLGGEIGLDPLESQLQSAHCRMGNGIHWRSTNAKIGYRYAINYRTGKPTAE